MERGRSVREIPFSIPQGCDLGSVHAAPHGPRLAIELSCAFGPAVVWLDVGTGSVRQPITDSDSHFLAWAPDGQAIYLRIDSINRPHIVRLALTGEQDALPISELTYDLAPAPSGGDFLFAFSRGMGLGSEIWLARRNGGAVGQLATDPGNYLALARWSPDGQVDCVRQDPGFRDAVHDRRTMGDAGRWHLGAQAGKRRCGSRFRAGMVAGWKPNCLCGP